MRFPAEISQEHYFIWTSPTWAALSNIGATLFRESTGTGRELRIYPMRQAWFFVLWPCGVCVADIGLRSVTPLVINCCAIKCYAKEQEEKNALNKSEYLLTEPHFHLELCKTTWSLPHEQKIHGYTIHFQSGIPIWAAIFSAKSLKSFFAAHSHWGMLKETGITEHIAHLD